MTILSTLQHYAAEWHTAREWARTNRMIAGLPAEIRKDIGWPDFENSARNRRTMPLVLGGR